jgi:chorismate synthase
MLRVLTAGESHGPELVAIMEGLPAGVPISRAAIQADLARRKLGYGPRLAHEVRRGRTVHLGGVRHGESLGSPIALRIGNTEWPKWVEVMSPDPVDLTEQVPRPRRGPHPPRPGHADLVGMQKYGFDEARPILERASAARRPPAWRSARSHARSSASSASVWSATRCRSARARSREAALPHPTTSTRSTPTRCAASTPRPRARMVDEVDAARKDGDTLGGVVEVLAYGCRPGSARTCTGIAVSTASSRRRS